MNTWQSNSHPVSQTQYFPTLYPPGYSNLGYSYGTGAGYSSPDNVWRPGCYGGFGAPSYAGCAPCSGFVPVPDYYRRLG